MIFCPFKLFALEFLYISFPLSFFINIRFYTCKKKRSFAPQIIHLIRNLFVTSCPCARTQKLLTSGTFLSILGTVVDNQKHGLLV